MLRVRMLQFGYDQGVPATFKATEDGTWTLPVMDRWPSLIQVNIFGFDDYFLGDADGDGVMDRLPPNSLSANYFNSLSFLSLLFPGSLTLD
jgi:alpha-1,3-glucan synthase